MPRIQTRRRAQYAKQWADRRSIGRPIDPEISSGIRGNDRCHAGGMETEISEPMQRVARSLRVQMSF
jgi:hypothetical protein